MTEKFYGNKKYLEEMKEARKKWMSDFDLDSDKMVKDENCDRPRIAIALEIIAETFMEFVSKYNYHS